uniref:(northern house mosquito) hypothetical protein n=1 Tax=Culex pipiens TaxID=7175 RepID=A0A8D8C9T2_CULPI
MATNHTMVNSETPLLDEIGTISRETSTDNGEGQGVCVTLGDGMVKICIRHTFQPPTVTNLGINSSTPGSPIPVQTDDFNQQSPDEPAAASFQKLIVIVVIVFFLFGNDILLVRLLSG